MPTTLADAFVRLRASTKELGPELKRETERAGADAGTSAGERFGHSMATAIKRAAIGLAVGAVAGGVTLARYLKQATADASNLNETVSKSQNIFPHLQDQIETWAKTSATALGLSRQAALEGAASFGNFFNQIGIGEKQAATMSTRLIQLSADLGSFNNASPADVMNAFLSATRGEYDALQRFIPTINAATVQAEALRLSHKKNAKDLTDAEKAQALYNIAFRDAGKAQGDFARTSGGLANQQRILQANLANLRAEIGTALLPVVTSLITQVNTKLIPILFELWSKHGPAITAFLQRAADATVRWATEGNRLGKAADQVKAFVAGLQGKGPIDGFTGALNKLGLGLRALVQSFRDGDVTSDGFVGEMEKVGSRLRVLGVVFDFAAKHADLLAKALPYIVVGFVALKAAQAAHNITVALGIPLQFAQAIGAYRMRAALKAHTAALIENTAVTRLAAGAQVAETAAQNAGILARGRAIVSMVAHKVASIAARGATIAWTAVQWLLNAALTANPIGLIIVAIAALVAGFILAYKHSDTFRRFVDANLRAVVVVAKEVFDWLNNTGLPIAIAVFRFLAEYVGDRIRFVIAVVRTIVHVVAIVHDAFERARAAVVDRLEAAVAWVRALPGRIVGALGDLGSMLWNKGRDLISGFVDGIRAQAGRVRDVLVGLLPGPLKRFAGELGLASPSKLFAKYGRDTIEGYIIGLRQEAGRLDATMAAIAPTPGAFGAAGQPSARSTVDTAAGAGASDLLEALRRIEELLASLRLVVTPDGLALLVRKGEKRLGYT